MRIFALSDVHVDYEDNAKWIGSLSSADYRSDVLLLAGDVTSSLSLLDWCLGSLVARFHKVLFVPGNHDLWVVREAVGKTSLQKFDEVATVVRSAGASMELFRERDVAIVPIFGWYDYSFGEPTDYLKSIWMDYHACRWPEGHDVRKIAAHFDALNFQGSAYADKVITFSHFMPRIDVLPNYIRRQNSVLHPVLGSTHIERQLRRLEASVHVYGHSHVNGRAEIEGVSYVNNAMGYPHEVWAGCRRLVCVHEA